MLSMPESTNPIKIFFCYAREDESLRKELEKQLRILKRQGLILSWHDREISAGKEWAREIDIHLKTAQIILLLISPDFMDSDYCYGVEMKQALERHEARETCVIPIILRPVHWEDSPFHKLQALPTDGKPVTLWSNQDEAFWDIAKGIRNVVKELLALSKSKEQWLSDGDTYYKKKRYLEALAAYEKAIQLDANYALAYTSKGNALRNLKQYEEALVACEKAIQLDPEDPRAYTSKGNALRNLKHYSEALDSYEEAIQLDPTYARANTGKGLVLDDLKRYSEALVACERAIQMEPDFARAYTAKGLVLEDLNRLSEALSVYDQAIYLDSNDFLAYIGKGNVLRTLQKYSEALDTYEQAIQLEPNDASGYYNKALVLNDLGKYEEAYLAYEQAVHLE